ncbi:MAG: DUF488 domain-containing protein [Armatimonadetes bacterium]|nr:DUF488 domain-containing protein [Armatimonadota bacterium]
MSKDPDEARTVYTIGHSNHPLETLLDLLRAAGIEALVDVRSQPRSGYCPHFDREPLEAAVAAAGMRYVFLGNALGGKPQDSGFYDEAGHVLYDRVAETEGFLRGLERLERSMERYRVAVLCGEEDPAHCHRRLLIGRVLRERGVAVRHIRGDGSVQDEEDLLAAEKLGRGGQMSLFDDEEDAPWRSTRSVSGRSRPPSSSAS